MIFEVKLDYFSQEKMATMLVTLFRAEIGLLILSSGLDSGCRVWAEKTRPRPTLGLGFNSRAGQIDHSVANGSPPLRRFFGVALPQTLSCGVGPRHLLPRFGTTSSVMKRV